MNNRFISILVIFCVLLPFSVSQAQNYITDTTFNSPGMVDSSLSQFFDVNTNPGYLQLQTGENENLARNTFAYIYYANTPPADTALRNPRKLIDGNYSTTLQIRYTPGVQTGAGSYILIDLNAVRRIKRTKFYPIGGNWRLRLRAYTIYAGTDTLALEKVFEAPTTPDSIGVTESSFDAITARYVKITVDFMDPNYSVALSEIEVFGEGYLPAGTFVSSVRNIGEKVNFGTFEYDANIPEGTSMTFNFRTGNSGKVDSSWSPWSEVKSTSGTQYSVFEPRQYIQYKVNMNTSNLLTPELNSIRINYDTNNVVSDVRTIISPQYVPVLQENEFTVSIDAKFKSSDFGIDSLIVLTPSPATVTNILVNGSPVSVLTEVLSSAIRIYFPTTVKTDSKIEIKFKATPYLAVNPFIVRAVSKNIQNNFQQLDTPLDNGVEGWSIITTGVPEKLLISAKAEPNPFTPNGDGRNDETRISFFLGNIAEPQSLIGLQERNLKIKIYDLTGRLIKNLINEMTRSSAFIADNSFVWDGRDESGALVRPGVYVYQIFIDSDNGGEYLSKTVVVSY